MRTDRYRRIRLKSSPYLFSPADSLDTAGGTRTPREPPGRRTESGEGKPLPRVLSLAGGAYFPASKRHRWPGANPEPLLRERFGVSFRFTPRRGGIGTVYPISRYMKLKRIIIGGRSLRYLPAAAIRLFSFTHD